ncbi:MAG: R3H domain-containing nucleic acid-binding protein [Candidatus Andersenbacteria bacterium]
MDTPQRTQEATQLDGPAIVLLEEHVRRVLEMMGFGEAEVDCGRSDSLMVSININAGDAGRALIGVRGLHLHALQHTLRCVLRKQLPAGMRVSVDVNGYRARRERSLLGLAEEVARKAARTGRTVVMQPMSASDRRTIHTALAGHKDVQTESLGDEPDRRVVVRPIFL